jgi:hypothetical protein
MVDPRRTPAIVGLIAGASLVIGSFLPWARASFLGITVSRSGIDDGGDGWFTFVAGVLAVVVFALVLRDGRSRHRGVLIVALLASGVAGVVGIADWNDVHDAVRDSGGIGHVGIGLYLVVLAAVVALVASVACLVRGPARPASAS